MEDLDFYRQATMPHLRKSRDDPLEMPSKIGPYKIDSILHRGIMSVMFLATHPESNTPLAVKILSPKLASQPEMIKQFLEETKIIGLTNHLNIVKLYGQGEWEKGLYIAMEFIQGISLKQFIMGQSLSLRRSLDIVLQTAYALLHLHTHGVIHRDLKPENILINENGKVKVIDFGIARLNPKKPTSGKTDGGIIGTPSYMSPEQRENPMNVGFNTDIFSLGIIAYELILGKLSFGNTQLDLLPENLKVIISKALKTDPKERYQDVVDLISDISNYLKGTSFTEDACEGDLLKETWEILGDQHKELLPKTLPTWPEIEFGLAKARGVHHFGVYYDFFRLPDNSFVIMLAESPLKTAGAISSIATLRGIIRSLMHQYIYPDNENPFITARFAEKLNQIFFDEPHDQNEAISILHLNPLIDEFSFVSTGFNSIWHRSSRGGLPRTLHNESPLLGQSPNAEYFSTNDSWNSGDLIILHSFMSPSLPKEEHAKVDALTLECINHEGQSASKTLANKLLEKLSTTYKKDSEKIVIALTRL